MTTPGFRYRDRLESRIAEALTAHSSRYSEHWPTHRGKTRMRRRRNRR